jgi:autotransporter-associated beta strand protein
LTIAGVTYLDAGAYMLFVTNGLGSSLASDPAFLSVNDPYIITQPVGHTNVPGATVSFTVSANGTPPVSYAWYKDNNPLSDAGNISGSASNTLTITSAGLPDVGNYNVIVASGSGSNVVSATAPLKITLPLGQVLCWDGNGTAPGAGDPPTGTWGTDNFWSTDAAGSGTPGGWSDGSTAVFSAGTDAVSAVTVTVNSTRAVTGITFEDGTVTLNGGTVSMIGANGQSTIGVADGLLATINTTVISGTNDLVKTGNGALRLNANNTFTGRTIIRGGTESVQADARFGAVPLSFQADNIILDGGTLECNATGNPGQQNNGQRGILITTNNGTIAETAANGTGALTVFGVISGPGKLTKTGGAVLRLENVNTFAGGTDLNDGKIYANTTGALGAGVIKITTNSATAIMLRTTLATTGVTITLTNDIVLTPGANPVLAPGGTGAGANFAVTGVISGDGGLTRNSTGDKDLILSGNNTFRGGFTMTDRYLVIGSKSAFGTGLLTLGDPSTPPANTLYLDAQFDLTGANAIPNPVVVNQQFSLALQLNHNIELSGPIDLGNPNIPIYANLTNGVHVFSGTVGSTNGYGFTKQGAGTLVLSGDNTYAGGTTVAGGTLAVNNSTGSGTGPGAVTVNAGTLVGSGTIGGPVSVGSDGVSWGTVSGGRGLATVGKLTLTNGLDMSTLGVTNAWELGALKDDSNGVAGTDFDQLAVTGGTVNVGGATLVLGFVGGASAPDPANPFWQANHTWTVVRLSGGASNPGSTNFAAIGNGSYAAGNFTTAVAGDGSIRLVFTAAPTVSIKTISATTTSATISWNTLSGLNYQVLYNTNVSTTNWLLLTNVTGNGGPITITDNHGGAPQRYYRLFAY